MDVSGWIISIVGVVLLSVVVDIVLPDGETAKYLKQIFSIIVVAVIVMPLPSLFSGMGLQIQDYFDVQESVTYDKNFLQFLTDQREQYAIEKIQEYLSENGVEDVTIDIVWDDNQVDLIIFDIKNAKLPLSFSHTQVQEIIYCSVEESLGIPMDKVRIESDVSSASKLSQAEKIVSGVSVYE